MSGNSFGSIFRITTAGESHGRANVVIIDGCPAGLPISQAEIQVELDRRRPGQSSITTQRKEADKVEILSGVFEGKTTGSSIALMIANQDQRSADYSEIKDVYRPGHADYTYQAKYGHRDYRGGGRASARETVARVAAGAVARKLIAVAGIRVVAYTVQVGDIKSVTVDPLQTTWHEVDQNPVRCPDQDAAKKMEKLIKEVRKQGDSLGGVCEVAALDVPVGLGEPVFDKLKADLAKAMMSVPAVLAFEYGAGTAVASMRGSECNDPFVVQEGEVSTESNRHGGMLGGISSGMPIRMRVTIKPTSSLPISQRTVDIHGQATEIRTKGRHDPCLLPRFVPVAEAMTCLVLADHLLRHRVSRISYLLTNT